MPADDPLRAELAALARQAIDSATDPASPDYCNFDRGNQPVVDAAFLSHAVVRAPTELWRALPRSHEIQSRRRAEEDPRTRPRLE